MDTPRTQADPEIVLIPNGFTGQLTVKVPTEADPSPEARRLAAGLAELADPDAELPPATMWDPTPSEDVRQVKWLEAVDQSLENRSITSAEWARLYAQFGRLARARGWLTEAGQQDLQAVVRTGLEAGGRR